MWTRTVRWIIAVTALLAGDLAQGEIPGTTTDLGNGVGIRSDPHGQGGPSIAPTESSTPLSPGSQGDVNQRVVTPFGSPQPPNQLTPAPVLPFHPNRPLMPQSTPHSGGGRFGR